MASVATALGSSLFLASISNAHGDIASNIVIGHVKLDHLRHNMSHSFLFCLNLGPFGPLGPFGIALSVQSRSLQDREG